MGQVQRKVKRHGEVGAGGRAAPFYLQKPPSNRVATLIMIGAGIVVVAAFSGFYILYLGAAWLMKKMGGGGFL